ncbi:hypothetical protein BX666DRAFT_2028366 [Dichotomocladium elegans]|nr:hypothetical protein BX666DRAFT_2028366 [Dichotomocladium elegans]
MVQQSQQQHPKAFTSPADEIAHLRSQNEQLWKIVEKQRTMIQGLQKDNIRLANERDGILSKYQAIDKELSVMRQNDPELLNDISTSTEDLNSFNSDGLANGPIPPPRSPFRRAISDESSSVRSPLTSPGSLDLKWARGAAIMPETASLSTMMLQSQSMHSPSLEVDGNSLKLCDAVVKVMASSVKADHRGKEVLSFLLAVGLRKSETGSFHRLWLIEKLYSDVLGLDAKLKMQQNTLAASQISKLPERALFNTHAPTKVDQRKMALENYIQHTLMLPWNDVSDLCEFLSTNVVNQEIYAKPAAPTDYKEGYLTKRGKNFGGWKRRYFIMQGDMIDYFESKEGNHLGTIRLADAQVGKQQDDGATATTDDGNSDSAYRHAFLINEKKRPGSSTVSRHILCAESDQERDEWVDAILHNIQSAEEELVKTSRRNKKEKGRKASKSESCADSRSSTNVGIAVSSGGSTIVGPTPSISMDSTNSTHFPPGVGMEYGRSSLDHHLSQQSPHVHPLAPHISRRTSMDNFSKESDQPPTPPRDPSPVAEDSLLAHEEPNERKLKGRANRMTFWGKMFNSNAGDSYNHSSSNSTSNMNNTSRVTIASSGLRGLLSRTSSDTVECQSAHPRGRSNSISSHQQQPQQKPSESLVATPEMAGPKRVFGVTLEEAVRISRVVEGYELPSVVYRCIEYLDAKSAVTEEGLYRLSGSNKEMRRLRQRFNTEGDVDLLSDEEAYDVHAVAGLLKMWLRELPTNVLTREHYSEFLHVIDLLNRKDRVNELGRLVSQLPLANYTLLRALSAHLLRVVQNADLNKMTARNVSIVFSMTLSIPPMIFSLFLSEFDYVFWTTESGDAAPRMIMSDPDKSVLDIKPALKLEEDSEGRSNRNSMNYVDGAPSSIVELERNHLDGM